MTDTPERYDIGTIALPAYVLLYRNRRTTSRWYVHRGYTNTREADDTAEAFRRVDMDALVITMVYDPSELGEFATTGL